MQIKGPAMPSGEWVIGHRSATQSEEAAKEGSKGDVFGDFVVIRDDDVPRQFDSTRYHGRRERRNAVGMCRRVPLDEGEESLDHRVLPFVLVGFGVRDMHQQRAGADHMGFDAGFLAEFRMLAEEILFEADGLGRSRRGDASFLGGRRHSQVPYSVV